MRKIKVAVVVEIDLGAQSLPSFSLLARTLYIFGLLYIIFFSLLLVVIIVN